MPFYTSWIDALSSVYVPQAPRARPAGDHIGCSQSLHVPERQA